MTRRGVERLLALVLALGMLSVTPTVVANLAGGRSAAPPWWSALVCAACLAVFVLLLVQAVRRASCRPPAWALVVLGDVALATYPLVVDSTDDDVPWVLALSPITVGAGAVATPSLLGALALTAVHLGFRFALQASGIWTVAGDTAALEAIGLLVVTTAASVAVLAVQGAARQVEAARATADRATAAAATARAVEREHSRWDGIVHDDVLASLAMTAHARDEADRRRAQEAAVRALASIDRGTTREESPVPLEEAVAALTLQVLSLHPPTVLTLPTGAGGRLDPDAADALVAATTEAVRNALRHGGSGGRPPTVRIRVRAAEGRLSVEVRDDGVGFDPRRATPRLGLAVSVRGRAVSVGGRVRLRSVPGLGTVVLLSVPLDASPDVPAGAVAAVS